MVEIEGHINFVITYSLIKLITIGTIYQCLNLSRCCMNGAYHFIMCLFVFCILARQKICCIFQFVKVFTFYFFGNSLRV